MNEQLYQARRRCAPPFFALSAKNLRGGGGRKSTPPGVRVLNHFTLLKFQKTVLYVKHLANAHHS